MTDAELEQAEQDAYWLEEIVAKMRLGGHASNNVRMRRDLLERLAQYARSAAPSPQRLSVEETQQLEALEDAESSEALRLAYARRKTTAESIFVLTAVDNSPGGGSHNHAWAWFRTAEEAEQAMREHAAFYFEDGYYDWAVIEEVKCGSVGPHPQTWFSATRQPDGTYVIERQAEAPEWYRDTANIGMG